jgi:trigger factor
LEYLITVDGESEKEIEVAVPAEDLKPIYEEEVDKLRKEVVIKGYRKGKVPKDLIRARYHETLKASAINDLISKSYIKVLEEKKWQPASSAELLELKEEDKIKFRLRIEVIPDFTVGNYTGLELFKEKPLPMEYLYEQAINQLREKYSTVRETAEPAAVDDFVTIDLEKIEKGKAAEKEQELTVKIGDRSLPDELNRALVGIKKGEKKNVPAGDVAYSVAVKKVEEKILPQLNDDFAKLLNYENMEALKKRIEEEMQKNEEARLEDELRESLAGILLERTIFSVPKVLVNDEYQRMLKNHNLQDTEPTRERFWPMADRRVRFNLIIEKIARQENIRTEEAEVLGLIDQNLLDVNEENRSRVIEYFRNFLNQKKTVDFLLQKAKISEKSRIISPEEAKNAKRPIRH